ncbi:unnamed protein product [Arabidopsis halleri]
MQQTHSKPFFYSYLLWKLVQLPEDDVSLSDEAPILERGMCPVLLSSKARSLDHVSWCLPQRTSGAGEQQDSEIRRSFAVMSRTST